MGAVAFLDGFRRAVADVGKTLRKPLMSGGVTGVKFKGFSKFGFASGEIPVVLHFCQAKIGMGPGQ